MSSVIIAWDTSGTVTLAAPAVSGTTTLTLPATTGTFITTGSTGQVINKASLPTGSVLQVVNATYSSLTSNTTTTYADSGITATITPSSSASKILVIISTCANATRLGSYNAGYLNIKRASTQLLEYVIGTYSTAGTETSSTFAVTVTYLDSPATTSATIYKMQQKTAYPGYALNTNYDNTLSSITLMEIAA